MGGDGIARLPAMNSEQGGLVLFVPLAAPGDEVLVQMTEKKKNFARAEIVEVLSPGPSRVQPPCPYFGRCGGCDWQQLSYEEQLKQKESIVREQLEKYLSAAAFEAIEPSPQPWRYRNRIQLKYEKPHLGFYARGSHQIVDIDDCLITEESLAKEIPHLKKKLLEAPQASVAKIELLLKTSGEKEVAFEDSPFEGVGFSQVNRWQNEKLISTVLEWAAREPFEAACDLYAGNGNFTFPLLERFPTAKLTGVELNPKTVQLTQETIASRSLSPKRIEFFLADVELFLKRFSLKKNSLVLLDPPRSGCSENVLKYLEHQPISRILYISCNPAALARDLSRLHEHSRPWRVLRVKPFDMFPQTDHVETLVELTR